MSSQILDPSNYFDPLSYIQKGVQIAGNQLQNNAQGINNRTLDQLNQARIDYLHQINTGQDITNQTNRTLIAGAAPQQAATTQNILANANLTNTQANYFPQTLKAQVLTALGRYAGGQAAQDRAFLATTQTPEGQLRMSKDSNFAQAASDAQDRLASFAKYGLLGQFGQLTSSMGLGNNQNNPMSNGSSSLTNTALTGNQGQLNGAIDQSAGLNGQNIPPSASASTLGQLLLAAQRNGDLANNVNSNGNVTAPTNPNAMNPNAQPNQAPPQQSGSSIMQEAATNTYLNKNLTSQQKQQIVRANSADAILKQVAPILPTLTKFTGLAGEAAYEANRLKAATGIGTVDPSYINYQIARDQTLPMAAGEIGQALGFRATDKQKIMLVQMTSPEWIDKNPKQAVQNFNTLITSLKGVEGQIAKTPAQGLQQLQSNIASPPFASTSPMQPGKVRVIDQNKNSKTFGQAGFIPAARLSDYLSNGYTRG